MSKQVTISAPPSSINPPSVNFDKGKFDDLIFSKGPDVIHEKALKCPCVSPNTNQQSDCKNCGGSGWIFVNSNETRMILHSANLTTQFKDWSELKLGTVSITCMDRENISYMDKITMIDGRSIYSEVLFLKEINSNLFFYTIYDIKEIQYIAVFNTTTTKLTNLLYTEDFTYSGNKIILNPEKWDSLVPLDLNLSITIRYVHSPSFHVLDLPRDVMVSWDSNQEKGPIQLPIHAIGRRSHFVLNAENFAGDRILDNTAFYTYDQLNPPKTDC